MVACGAVFERLYGFTKEERSGEGLQDTTFSKGH